MLGPVLSQCSPPRDQPTSTLPPSLIHQIMARDTQTLRATFEPLYYTPREVRHYQDEFCCNARRRRSACVERSPSATLIKSCLATTELLEVLSIPSSKFLANSWLRLDADCRDNGRQQMAGVKRTFPTTLVACYRPPQRFAFFPQSTKRCFQHSSI
jgi:hypothetical protein